MDSRNVRNKEIQRKGDGCLTQVEIVDTADLECHDSHTAEDALHSVPAVVFQECGIWCPLKTGASTSHADSRHVSTLAVDCITLIIRAHLQTIIMEVVKSTELEDPRPF